MDENQLNDLIGSRICHDLISPLGAIGNGVELLSLSGSGVAPELALISESIENANARIRYFRVAFGAAPADRLIGNSELRSILRDVYRGSRLRIDWRIDDDPPRSEAKLAFLAIQCLESALPWGGTISVARSADGYWTLKASGERLKLDPSLWEHVSNPRPETRISASEVQFALVRIVAQRLHRTVRIANDDSSITVNF